MESSGWELIDLNNCSLIFICTGLEAEAIGEKESDPDAELKSPISLVHELALKLNQTIEFAVVSLINWILLHTVNIGTLLD